MLSSRQAAAVVALLLSLASCSPAGSGPVGSSDGSTTGTGGAMTGGATGTAGSASAGTIGTGGSAGGGVTGTGGNGGATGTGGAGGGSSGALCPPSALVCEDFEDGTADGWSALVSGMTINGTHASSGTKALSLNIPENQRGGFISYKGAPLFPLLNKTMWGRVMVWFDSISDGHTDIVRGQAASGGNPSYNVAEQHGAYMMNYYNGSSATDCWKRPKAPTPTMVPLGKWQCWEWSFNAGTNDFQFFVDGTLYVHVAMTGDGCLTGNGPWVAPTDFGLVSVGATIAETRPTVMQIWIDDIAIGTQERIGCPTPRD